MLQILKRQFLEKHGVFYVSEGQVFYINLLHLRTALIYLTSFSGSFLTWVLSLRCILVPLSTPSLLFSCVAAIANLMVTSSPCSIPLWRFMKVPRPFTPVLFCNSSASRPLKIWASHRMTFMPWKTVCDRLS